MPENEKKVIVFCKICDCFISIIFSKDEFLQNAEMHGGLISGTFLHKMQNNEDPAHALLVYFDKDFNHRGTVCSKIIEAKSTEYRKEKK
jgi:hypothetical protein